MALVLTSQNWRPSSQLAQRMSRGTESPYLLNKFNIYTLKQVNNAH